MEKIYDINTNKTIKKQYFLFLHNPYVMRK